jgi:hypothetical protein
MSLVGNLEDLSLGDILQIISLSQKTGVLAVSSDRGSGRIVLRSGLVQGARLKGGPGNLGELLVSALSLEANVVEAGRAEAQESGMPLEEILARDAGLSSERTQELIRRAVESDVLEMLGWASGEFCFDARSELELEDPQFFVAEGMNAQYLAMEGLRILDERSREEEGGEADATPVIPAAEGDEAETAEGLLDPLELEPLEGGDPLADELDLETVWLADTESSATELLVASVVDRMDEALASNPVETDGTTEEMGEGTAPSETPQESRLSREVSGGDRESAVERELSDRAVVVIDPDLEVLAWVKASILEDVGRVHVFQKADQGLSRIRQYLIRGENPLVLISPETPIDPLSGIHGFTDFVKRLKTQCPRITIIGLSEQREGGKAARSSRPGVLSGLLGHPAILRRGGDEAASRSFRDEFVEIVFDRGDGDLRPSRQSGLEARLTLLRDATANLQEASSRGEILPVLLDFAHAIFDRVAILIVRENELFAIAGRGVAPLEVDPLASAPPIALPLPASGWIPRVLESRQSMMGVPTDAGMLGLLDRFGGNRPDHAYLGAVGGGASVTALLYGDQANSESEGPDTHGLDVLLQHAGLALERAALERVIWESEADPG